MKNSFNSCCKAKTLLIARPRRNMGFKRAVNLPEALTMQKKSTPGLKVVNYLSTLKDPRDFSINMDFTFLFLYQRSLDTFYKVKNLLIFVCFVHYSFTHLFFIFRTFCYLSNVHFTLGQFQKLCDFPNA